MHKKELFNDLYKINQESIINKSTKRIDKDIAKNIVKNINNNKLTIISWVKNTWKSKHISYILKKTNIGENFVYFDKKLDHFDIIKSNIELSNYINVEEKKYIILKNISEIKNIKIFLAEYYKKDKKIIIIWNDIRIPNIENIEIKPSIKNIENFEKNTKYWLFDIVNYYNFDKKITKLITKEIINESIINLKWVKNINMYYLTITYLAKVNKFLSIREIFREINDYQKIAPKTLSDYIDFSIQEKIIKKVDMFDIKKWDIINWKSKYYFIDNWIRNSLMNFTLEYKTLKENLIFAILNYYNFEIYWWKNWIFEFTFLVKKYNKRIYIHISESTDKNEIKKEVNKLSKINDNYKKYLIVDDLKKYAFEKTVYEKVEIIELEEITKKIP